MMKYQSQDKKQIKKGKQIIYTVIGFVFFVFIFVSGIVSWSGGFFHFIGRPLWKTENTLIDSADSISYIVRSKSSVFSENESLKKENADLNTQMIDYNLLKSENENLKGLFNRVPANQTLMLSAVLSKPNRSPYDTLVIDIGNDNGVVEGSQVFANGDIPIGQIESVHNKTSVVTLYSSPSYNLDAELSNTNNTIVLIGRGGGNFEMSIPVELNVQKGDLAVLPGLHSSPVAIVQDIISSPTDPLKKVLLQSPVNIQELKWVEVER